MTAKEYLRQYEYADRRAKRLKEEYDEELLRIDAIRSASDNDGMPHGTNISRPTEDKAIKLTDKALKWQQAELDAIEARQRVFELIYDIDGIEGDVLISRYVKLHKWEEICVELHYSWHGIHAAHRRALDIVSRALNGTNI